MVGKKRNGFDISNRLAYTLIVIALIVGLGIGVFAYGGSSPSVVGHTTGEIAWPACSAGQVLGVSGGNVVCVTPASGNDPRFTISSSGLCYNAPATCSTFTAGCSASASIQYSFNTCSTTPQVGMDQICTQQCRNQKGNACDGTSGSCSGTVVQYNGVGTSCSPSLNILYCTCSSSGTYTQAVSIPAGQRCI